MFVPEMMGLRSNELGHRNFQHPQRNEMHFGPYTDNFSAWVIYLSLRCIMLDPQLWQRETSGDECLLFHQVDYANPAQSKLFNELLNHSDAQIREYASFLKSLCLGSPERVPPLAPTPPSIESLTIDKVHHKTDGDHDGDHDKAINHNLTHENELEPNQNRDPDRETSSQNDSLAAATSHGTQSGETCQAGWNKTPSY